MHLKRLGIVGQQSPFPWKGGGKSWPADWASVHDPECETYHDQPYHFSEICIPMLTSPSGPITYSILNLCGYTICSSQRCGGCRALLSGGHTNKTFSNVYYFQGEERGVKSTSMSQVPLESS